MKQTAVEWLQLQIDNKDMGEIPMWVYNFIEQAKEMETKEKLKHQLFIGKVFEILDFDKTVELLKQCNDEII
jgi:hypothetical protein